MRSVVVAGPVFVSPIEWIVANEIVKGTVIDGPAESVLRVYLERTCKVVPNLCEKCVVIAVCIVSPEEEMVDRGTKRRYSPLRSRSRV